MHIAERLLNIRFIFKKNVKTTKKKYKIQKKSSNKVIFQMQRCRLRLTALTLQSTR